MAGFWRHITGDSQLRYKVGPDKGVIHLATAAIVNAVWDLWAKAQGKPGSGNCLLAGPVRPSSWSLAWIFVTSPMRSRPVKPSPF